MKSWLAFGVFLCTIVGFVLMPKAVPTTQAALQSFAAEPVVRLEFEPILSAKAYAVIDIDTGEIIASNNANTVLPIASVTKLFTAASALKASQLDEEVEVTAADVASEGRAGKLAAGQTYTLRELLFPLLLESSNDAAAVFERLLPLDLFVGVSLADASGLSAQNTATAEGLALAVKDLYQHQSQLFDITSLTQYISKETGWINNSPVRDLPGYLGGKHGYTEASNRTLVAIFSEPELANRELGYVILGSENVRADLLVLRSSLTNSAQAK